MIVPVRLPIAPTEAQNALPRRAISAARFLSATDAVTECQDQRRPSSNSVVS